MDWAELLAEPLAGGGIIVDPTYYCNMACEFCSLPIASRLEIDLERMAPIMSSLALVGMRTLVLTGGEPGIYARLDRFLDLCRRLRLRVSMLSNGTWAIKAEKAARQITRGIHEIVLSLKAFDAATSRALTNRSHHAHQLASLSVLGRLAADGVLGRLSVNHVLTGATLDGMAAFAWREHVAPGTIVVISLVEPYTEAMLGLVPDFDSLAAALPAALNSLHHAGLPFQLEGFPLCLLGTYWTFSRDATRNRDDLAKVFIKPTPEADYVLHYRGYQRILQFAHVQACAQCVHLATCPGLHKKMLPAWANKVKPVAHSCNGDDS
jgi:hypothetical protein